VIEQAGVAGASNQDENDRIKTRIVPMRGAPRDIAPSTGAGGHGGGDAVMLADIFDPNAPADPLKRAADERGGAASCLIGIAADKCFETGQPVKIADLITGLTSPDWPKMPNHADPVPMPQSTSQV
jgi:hypothetical protein